ncbi:MAG: amino acid ABC transporter ATP-binding protein [Liquorilactobacillus nagelii]|jgi:polar amino acid transport system ATP-binding protein|uniref:amino acid ABC transporter ATP-binding protein n=1 Tax=Liquorilactobacillus nagelii TaxID=82688 RepID=UPI00242FE103|nr:amino acid ABC transporter ATP-binding protein [Liquorilactobacillus nagelii]MCI1921158.1 amino acid ABC transporter ATP-binding protein [Liquorilactobacillus nagelii]MCI1977208.1 amino acid ABC transporter ATP-binding protein [Liquorilactobacillus nagelii]
MLELKNVSKTFNQKTVWHDLNLKIEDGQILCIVGQSGGGKTTLLRCISGLESLDNGEMLVDGKKFDPTTPQKDDAVIGVVFQDYQLFPHLKVIDNITLAPELALKQTSKQARQAAEKLLAQLSLTDKADLFPYQLSGGQKQRVAIARALAMKPKILCYDEPTSALDPGLREAVKKIILQLKKAGITQIVVTHDWEFARQIADQTFKLEPQQ